MKKVLSILTGIIFSCNLIAQSDGGSKYIAHFDGGKGFFGKQNRISVNLLQPLTQKAFGLSYDRALKRKLSFAASLSIGKQDFNKSSLIIRKFPQVSNFSIFSIGYRRGTRIGLPALAGSSSGLNVALSMSTNKVSPPVFGQVNSGVDFASKGLLSPYEVKEKHLGIEYVVGNAWVVAQQIQIDFSMIFGINYRFQSKSNAMSTDLTRQTLEGDPYMSAPRFMPVNIRDYTTTEGEIAEKIVATVMPRLKVSYLF